MIKFLHILGAILLLGNVIVTGTWLVRAERTKEPQVMRFAARTVNWADALFTVPGVVLLFISGIILSNDWGGIFGTNWIVASIAFFCVSGILWAVFLLPYQFKLVKISDSILESGTELTDDFFKILHKWYLWGSLSILAVVIAFIFMIFKPNF